MSSSPSGDSSPSLGGWFVVGLVVVLGAGACWYVRTPADRHVEDTSGADKRWVAHNRIIRVVADGYQHPKISDPVFARQAHYIKRHIAACVAASLIKSDGPHQLEAAFLEQLDTEEWTPEMIGAIREAARAAEPGCARALVDVVLSDARMARRFAQAVKSLGIAVDESFDGLPNTWPEGMDDPTVARTLTRVVGL